MAIITKEKLDKVAEIIRRHVGWFLWRLFGDLSSVDSSKVNVPSAAADKLPVSIVQLSFILGEQEALLKESEWETYGWGDLNEAAKKPLTELEQLQVRAAELSAYSAFRRLGEDIVDGLYDELAQATGSVISESQVRGIIKDKIKFGVETNRAYFDVAKDLVGDLKEKKRNWYRVASTEMHKARQLGVANAIIGKKDIYRDSDGIDSLVTIVPAPDACGDCKRLYLEAGGNPKIFKLTELLNNSGSNYQRPWRKNAKPVIPPLHPHCFCRIRYAPPGWGWNKEGRFTLIDPDKAFNKSFTHVRQSVPYGCSAAALKMVLQHNGVERSEKELLDKLDADPDNGASPNDIARVSRDLGLKVQILDHLKLDDLEELSKEGIAVIVAYQSWQEPDAKKVSWDRDWKDGHYSVVLRIDEKYIHVVDPATDDQHVAIPKDEFVRRWHDEDQSRKWIRLGIVIYRGKKAKP